MTQHATLYLIVFLLEHVLKFILIAQGPVTFLLRIRYYCVLNHIAMFE